jgi:hypothetical protein
MPSLTFGDGAHIHNLSHAHPPKKWKPSISARGVVDLQPAEVWGEHGVPKELFAKLSSALHSLQRNNMPIWFIACSKEAQLIMRLIAQYIKIAVNRPGYEYVGDYGLFNVHPNARGWTPHRDNDSPENALEPDGLPNYITAWMPLTEATTKSSCMYYIPRMYDPKYETGGVGEEYFDTIFKDNGDYQNILSLPMIPGGLVCHSSRTVHWGSRPLPPLHGEKPEYENRQAISVGVAHKKLQTVPLRRKGAMEYPTFVEAVVLAISHAMRYMHHVEITEAQKKCFRIVLKEHIELFSDDHQETIDEVL